VEDLEGLVDDIDELVDLVVTQELATNDHLIEYVCDVRHDIRVVALVLN
jgi:hypothetical protein